MKFKNNLIEFVNSITPSIRHEANIGLENGGGSKKKHIQSANNLFFEKHMVRSENSINQVYKYPKFQNLHILKIIENELGYELDLRDDIDIGKELKGEESTSIKKDKYMSKGNSYINLSLKFCRGIQRYS